MMRDMAGMMWGMGLVFVYASARSSRATATTERTQPTHLNGALVRCARRRDIVLRLMTSGQEIVRLLRERSRAVIAEGEAR